MQAQPVFSIIPFFFIFVIYGGMFAAVNYYMAKNKGLNAKKYLLIGFIPVVGWFMPIIILSKPNQIILDKLTAIEEKLNQL